MKKNDGPLPGVKLATFIETHHYFWTSSLLLAQMNWEGRKHDSKIQYVFKYMGMKQYRI